MKNLILPSRSIIVKKVIGYLTEDQNRYIHVFGGRGTGKTYLLDCIKKDLANEPQYIVLYYKFKKRPELPLEEWIDILIEELPPINIKKQGLRHVYLFEHILESLQDPNIVPFPKKIILLLDDFHCVNDYINFQILYYNFLEMLYDKTSNFSVVATTLMSYRQGKTGGSPFYLSCCTYFPNLQSFTLEDIRILFPDLSEDNIKEIKLETGGQPEITMNLVSLLSNNEFKAKFEKKQFSNLWDVLEERILIEKFIHHLNEEERELLVKIALDQEHQDFVDIQSLYNREISRQKFDTQVSILKDTGLVEQKRVKGVYITGEILRRKIIKKYFLLNDIADLIYNSSSIQEEFNYMGYRNGVKIKEWILNVDNQDFIALVPDIKDIRSYTLALEISSLANTFSGIVCFGLNKQGGILKIDFKEIESRVNEALIIIDSTELKFVWGTFFISGQELKCLLVSKSKNKIDVGGTVYIKSSGYPIEKSKLISLPISEYREVNKSGFLFFRRLYSFNPTQRKEKIHYVSFDEEILKNSNNVRLFFEWIEENKGESVMIEFKGVISKNKERREHICKQMVAMANTRSGVLICGIIELKDGKFELCGVADPDQEEKEILSLKIDAKLKNIDGHLQQINYKNKTFVFYFIRKPDRLASYCKDVYKRNGRQKELVKTAMIPQFYENIFEKGPKGYLVLDEFLKWKQRNLYA